MNPTRPSSSLARMPLSWASCSKASWPSPSLATVANVRSSGGSKAGDTFGEMALMSGDKTMADFIAEARCCVLRIPVAVFQSAIMTDPRAVQHISRTIADRFKQVMADPAKAAAAFRQSDDPYGLRLQGERPEKILVVNSGSSSLKYTFFDTSNEPNTARAR